MNQPTRVFTFYSYKGGVGRSMALANVAALLAREGARVLMADWDLEAPGLDLYFRDGSGVEPFPSAAETPGIVDLVHDLRAGPSPDWRDYLTRIELRDAEYPVHLMPAGRRDDDYVDRLQQIDWRQLFRENDFAGVLERMREDWLDAYDVVLIDSRTGITDIGGICTVYLPDVIVALFSASHQNLEGVAEVLRRARDRRGQLPSTRTALLVLPVPARDEARTEYEQSVEWQGLYVTTFESLYRDVLPREVTAQQAVEVLRLPNVPYWSFGERLPVLEESGNDPSTISYYYAILARLIASGLDWHASAPSPGAWGGRSAQGAAGRERPQRSLGAVLRGGLSGRAPMIMGGTPSRNPHFAGRRALLQKLAQTLSSSARDQAPVTLLGLGGIGKSQLAAEYVQEHQGEFGLIWWIPAAADASVRHSLMTLARRLGLPASEDAEVTVATIMDRLRLGDPVPNWLLVFDDAGEPETLKPYLPKGPGRVLVTARSHSWRGVSSALEIGVFEPAESVDFLRSRWPDLTEAQALDLASRVGHLPLALDQAAAVHAETAMPLAEYLQLLERSPAELLAEGEGVPYPSSLATVWKLAFERLREQSLAAAQLLEVCACLSSTPVYLRMLERGRDAALPSPLAEAVHSTLALRAAVGQLGRFALAQLDTSRDFISVHTLVRAMLRDQMTPEHLAATQQAAQEILALASPGMPDDSRTWPQHAQVTPHLREAGTLQSSDARVRQLVLDQIRYAYVIGDYAQSRALATEARDAWSGPGGPADEPALAAAFHCGNALRALGDYEGARATNQDTLTRMRRILGPDHQRTLRVASSAAADYRLLGESATALAMDEENLALARHTLGEDHVVTLRLTNNLAVDHRLLGNFAMAKALDEATHARRTALLNERHPDTLRSAANLARDLYHLGEYEDALTRMQAFVPDLETMQTGVAVQAQRDHAVLLRATGATTAALDAAREVHQKCLLRLGPRHELTMAAATTVFNTLRICGEPAEALSLARQVLATYTSAFGAGHPFTLACAANLAVVLRALDRAEEAHDLDRRTLAAFETVLRPGHPHLLICKANLATGLAALRRTAEALEQSTAAYESLLNERGERHPHTLLTGINLALDLDAAGRPGVATALRERLLPTLRERLGDENPDVAAALAGRRIEHVIEVAPV
jgi:cellulose biosynthesis protein BcsQ